MNAGTHRVAVVVDRAFGSEALSDLAGKMHVWLLDTEFNSASARQFYEQGLFESDELLSDGITLFSVRAAEPTGFRVLQDVLESVNEHHNEYSLSPGWLELHVYGVPLDAHLRAMLEDFGFSDVRTSSQDPVIASKPIGSSID